MRLPEVEARAAASPASTDQAEEERGELDPAAASTSSRADASSLSAREILSDIPVKGSQPQGETEPNEQAGFAANVQIAESTPSSYGLPLMLAAQYAHSLPRGCSA